MEEKTEKMSEGEALRMLLSLRAAAIVLSQSCSGSFFEELKEVFEEVPEIVTQAKRVEKAKSQVFLERFKEKKLNSFLDKFASGISSLTAQHERSMGINSYLDLRGEVVDFVTKPFGLLSNPAYQFDFIFEHYKVMWKNLDSGRPNNYQDLVIMLIAGFRMFNSIAPESIPPQKK